MTDLRMALLELLSKYKDDGQLDALREGVRLLAQALMELEVSQEIGAERYQRTEERKTYRNGYRKRRWDTRVGTVQLKIPKLRKGSYFPSLLEPRRRAERALLSVIREAYVQEHPRGGWAWSCPALMDNLLLGRRNQNKSTVQAPKPPIPCTPGRLQRPHTWVSLVPPPGSLPQTPRGSYTPTPSGAGVDCTSPR